MKSSIAHPLFSSCYAIEGPGATVLAHAQKLADTLPDVRTILAPGAGHILPVTHPEAVVDAGATLQNM